MQEKEKFLDKHYSRRRFGLTVFCLSVLAITLYTLCRGLLAAHADYASVVPNTIFLDNAPVTFTLSSSSSTISYTVTDLNGATVTTGRAPVSDGQARITLAQEPDGYYVLHVTDQHGGSGQSLSFAIVAPFTRPHASPLGVGVHFTGGDDPGLAPLIARMGVTSVRDDATWALLERAPGQYNFDALDTYMPSLQQNGLDPLLILDYNNRFYDNGKTPYDNAGFTAFARYAQTLVIHYGPQVKAVEVYNEFNGLLSNGPCARKPSCYVTLLRYTYQAVKAVRPDITVVGGAALFADRAWFQQLFQLGALRYMDVVSDHPYTTFYVASPEVEGTRREMTDLESLIRQYNHGAPKPLWITELGWSTTPTGVSERTQAGYLVRGAVLALAAGVQKFYWYDMLNDGRDRCNGEQNFGLLRRPDAAGRYTPKPAFVAYAVLARALASRSFIRSEPNMLGIYDERFTDNLDILWSVLGTQKIVITTRTALTVTSMTGEAQTLVPIHGQVTLNLTGDPIYVGGSIGGIAWQPWQQS